jgi:hypothetical protein
MKPLPSTDANTAGCAGDLDIDMHMLGESIESDPTKRYNEPIPFDIVNIVLCHVELEQRARAFGAPKLARPVA